MILDFIENPRFVLSLFDETPRLGMVEASRLGLNRDGPALEIELLSSVLPEKMPKKYGGQRLNASCITLSLSFVQDLEIASWGVNNSGSFQVHKSSGRIHMAFSNPAGELIFKARCACIDLKSWIPYLREHT